MSDLKSDIGFILAGVYMDGVFQGADQGKVTGEYSVVEPAEKIYNLVCDEVERCLAEALKPYGKEMQRLRDENYELNRSIEVMDDPELMKRFEETREKLEPEAPKGTCPKKRFLFWTYTKHIAPEREPGYFQFGMYDPMEFYAKCNHCGETWVESEGP